MNDSLETLLQIRQKERDVAERDFNVAQKRLDRLLEEVQEIDHKVEKIEKELAGHERNIDMLNSSVRRSLDEYRRGCDADCAALQKDKVLKLEEIESTQSGLKRSRERLFEAQKQMLVAEEQFNAAAELLNKSREKRAEDDNDEHAARKAWEES